MSYAELWSSMHMFAKGIVLVMFIMSAWSWAVSISKQLYLRKSQKETRKFAPEFSRYLQEEQLDGAIALAEKNKKSHVARVLGEALSEVKPLLRDRATITAADINSAERAVERQMLIITAELKRGLGILATTGATAPSVGLLGTPLRIVSEEFDEQRRRAHRRQDAEAALQLGRDDEHLPFDGPLGGVDVRGRDGRPVAQQRFHFGERLTQHARHVAFLILFGERDRAVQLFFLQVAREFR